MTEDAANEVPRQPAGELPPEPAGELPSESGADAPRVPANEVRRGPANGIPREVGSVRRLATRPLPHLTKRRWGYIVWFVGLGFIFVPEILAAKQSIDKHLPFTTISAMVGNLEFQNDLWELAPTILIVFVLYSLVRTPPKRTSGGHTSESIATRAKQGDERPHRTAGGRLTFKTTAKTVDDFDEEHLDLASFVLQAIVVAGIVVGLTLWAHDHWPPAKGKPLSSDFHVGYFLYGSIAFFWIVLPSLYAFIRGRDAAFPTLFMTIVDLEEWLGSWRRWPWLHRLGQGLSWLVAFALVWGLVFLMIHLTLYPYPDITHILNPGGK